MIDSADEEVSRMAGFSWWSENGSAGRRCLRVLPYLRECRTTAADLPMMKPEQALEFMKNSKNVDLQTVSRKEMGSIEEFGSNPRLRTQARLNHFLTIGLTKPCRKVEVESLASVNR